MGMKHLSHTLAGAVAGLVMAGGLAGVTAGPATANGNCVTYWMAGGAWSGAPAAGGTGTSADPYLVGSENDLNEVRFCAAQHFRQIADLSLSPGWDPIDPLTGVYDGDTHSITGLSIDEPSSDNVGLFSRIEGGLVNDLSLSSGSVTGNFYAGLLAGQANSGRIRNVTAQGSVVATGQGALLVGRIIDSTVTQSDADGSVTGTASDVGGIAGFAGTSHLSEVAVEVTVSAPSRLGGIVGSTCESHITKAAAAGTITGGDSAGGIVGLLDCGGSLTKSASSTIVTGTDFVGGAVGSTHEAPVSEVATEGSVSGHDSVGGIAGRLTDAPLSDSAADVQVTGHASVGGAVGRTNHNIDEVVASGAVTADGDYSGALAGQLHLGEIRDSSASGDVTSSAESATGGLVGSVTSGVIRDSAASGAVTNTRAAPAPAPMCTGGLVGCLIEGEIHRSSATGAVTAAHGSDGGGLVGSAEHAVVDSSLARGNVHAKGNGGGLIGQMVGAPGRVADSYAQGDVSATGNSARAGGLIGHVESDPGNPLSWSELSSTYATGKVRAPKTSPDLIGGLVGHGTTTGPVESFWSSTANPSISGGSGVPKTATALRTGATYADAGWDIQTGGGREDATWGICLPATTSVNHGYAFLTWEHPSDDPCPTPPAAPTLKSVTGGDRSLAVIATLGSDHHSPVTAVQYSLDGGAWHNTRGKSGSFTIGGLTNGTTYKVRVRAVNAVGPGIPSNAKSGTPTAGPIPQTNLHVSARGKHRALPIGKRSPLVKSVHTDGTLTAVRAICSLNGVKLGQRQTKLLCGLRVHAPATADGVPAASAPRVRISADPSCSGVKVRTRIVAKKAGATRDTFTRSWRTRPDRGNRCSIHGTG